MSEELKPCPFCGANDINVGESALPDTTREDGAKKFEVSCECLCAGPARRTREEAISDWNRRPSPPPAVGEVGGGGALAYEQSVRIKIMDANEGMRISGSASYTIEPHKLIDSLSILASEVRRLTEELKKLKREQAE